MSSIYVYAWGSGLCIEWAENKINKIDGDTIYFYNGNELSIMMKLDKLI